MNSNETIEAIVFTLLIVSTPHRMLRNTSFFNIRQPVVRNA